MVALPDEVGRRVLFEMLPENRLALGAVEISLVASAPASAESDSDERTLRIVFFCVFVVVPVVWRRLASRADFFDSTTALSVGSAAFGRGGTTSPRLAAMRLARSEFLASSSFACFSLFPVVLCSPLVFD